LILWTSGVTNTDTVGKYTSIKHTNNLKVDLLNNRSLKEIGIEDIIALMQFVMSNIQNVILRSGKKTHQSFYIYLLAIRKRITISK